MVEPQPRPLADYHEDYGPVLWWVFPVTEPPYVGSPLHDDWPGYHTHWTPVPVPPDPDNASLIIKKMAGAIKRRPPAPD